MKKITLLIVLALVALCSTSKAITSPNRRIIEGRNLVKSILLNKPFTIIHTAYIQCMSYSGQHVFEITGFTMGPSYPDLYPCGTSGYPTCDSYISNFELDGSGEIKIGVSSTEGLASRECIFYVDGDTQAIKCYRLDRQGDYYVFSLTGIDLSYPRQFQFEIAAYGNCPY